jgi:Regulator of chromosome condensation (RCC1) repeat
MQVRNTQPWYLFLVCACLSGCTLLVDSAIEEKPAHELDERDADAGGARDASNGGRDGSTPADGSMGGDDGATTADDGATPADTGAGEDTGAQTDGGTAAGKICVGYNHACGLDASGKVTCWGANSENQRTLPADRTYLDVACGDYHSCAIDAADGSLICVGRNRDGQRANEAGPFAQVTAGDGHTCTLDAAGAARCWGANNFEQSTPPAGAFSTLSAGGGFTCGIRSANGALECWGSGASAINTQAAGKKLLSIEAGPTYVCGVTEARDGLCWGQRDYSISGLVEVQQIAAGSYSGCALLADDSVTCWYNGFSEPLAPTNAPFASVAVGGTGRCAVRKSGGVYCEPEDTSALVPGPNEFP